MSKHTPGPWIADWDDGGQWYVNIGGLSVSGNALRGDSGGCIESANARLIAAAPELLEACKWFLAQLESGMLVRDITKDAEPMWGTRMMRFVAGIGNAARAIAKAEGLSPENAEASHAPTPVGRDDKGGE